MLSTNSFRGPASRWRQTYHPLRGLTLSRVTALCEAYDRGEMAEVQWAFRAAERRDADLLALVERRTEAILEMDWTVREGRSRVARRGGRMDDGLVREQSAALREAYEVVDNLYEAIEHLSLAVFRGFAHAQKQRRRTGGDVTHLEPVDPWNVVRDGPKGDPGAASSSAPPTRTTTASRRRWRLGLTIRRRRGATQSPFNR
jgi:hypothetical protein